MGLALCTLPEYSAEKRHIIEFGRAGKWQSSEEETDEEDCMNFVRCRSRSLPDDVSTRPWKTKNFDGALRRNRGYSLQDRMKQRHRSPVVNLKAERAAKQYTNKLKDDSVKHLRHTVRIVDSIGGKKADMNEELRRQERVLRNADYDISYAEYETDLITQRLKNMRSLRSKLASTIPKRKPKLNLQPFNDFDLLDGETRFWSMSRTCPTKSRPIMGGTPKAAQIKSAIGELHAALDVVKVQQMDTSRVLKRQVGHLATFEDKLDCTNTKINTQSKVVNSMIPK